MAKPKKRTSSAPKRVRQHMTPLSLMVALRGKDHYTRPHPCAFCGALGFAHDSTRLSAHLFCDPVCARAYKYLREHPL